jgi:putative hydrolase of the HAD superfamily
VGLRAVFLDAGNTLIGLDYELIATRLQSDGHAVTPDRVRTAEARARVRLDPHLASRQSTEASDVFARYVRYMLEELSIAWGEDGARLAGDLRAGRLGLRLAVVSNSNGSVARLLENHGLTRWLDAVVDSGVVGFEKPDPRIFHHAAAALGVEPADAVHVGDLYSVDVVGARAAGVRAILLDPVGAWAVDDCPKVPDVAAAARLIARMT